jgi:uncharacterized GH25 family protein
MKRPCVFLSVLTLAAAASVGSAHQLKVMASKLVVPSAGEHATVYLSWGHVLPVDDLVDADSVERYDLIAPDGKATPLKKDGLSMQSNVVEFKDEGLHQMVATKKAAVFTIVLDDEGNSLFKRGPKSAIKEGTIDRSFRSQQFAKTLLTVGEPKGAAPKPLGLPLEITPLDMPADWRAGRELRFGVQLQGKPVGLEEVRATRVGFKPDGAYCFAASTDRQGVVTVLPKEPGTWVIELELRKPADDVDRKDFDDEDYIATLVLEVQHGKRKRGRESFFKTPDPF